MKVYGEFVVNYGDLDGGVLGFDGLDGGAQMCSMIVVCFYLFFWGGWWLIMVATESYQSSTN